MIQRVLTIVLVVLIFLPQTGLAVAFVFFPALGWAAIRASRRETHWQLFLFCLAIYVLTLNGHGPLVSPIEGVPESLSPGVLYLFIAAMAFMMVPLTLTVEALSAMTGQATRAATTVERLLDSVSGALIIATDAKGRITHYNVGAQQTLGYLPGGGPRPESGDAPHASGAEASGSPLRRTAGPPHDRARDGQARRAPGLGVPAEGREAPDGLDDDQRGHRSRRPGDRLHRRGRGHHRAAARRGSTADGPRPRARLGAAARGGGPRQAGAGLQRQPRAPHADHQHRRLRRAPHGRQPG